MMKLDDLILFDYHLVFIVCTTLDHTSKYRVIPVMSITINLIYNFRLQHSKLLHLFNSNNTIDRLRKRSGRFDPILQRHSSDAPGCARSALTHELYSITTSWAPARGRGTLFKIDDTIGVRSQKSNHKSADRPRRLRSHGAPLAASEAAQRGGGARRSLARGLHRQRCHQHRAALAAARAHLLQVAASFSARATATMH